MRQKKNFSGITLEVKGRDVKQKLFMRVMNSFVIKLGINIVVFENEISKSITITFLNLN